MIDRVVNKHQGFTLMEVLVALVILSVAFSAIFMAVSTNSRTMFYLINKTAADWIALNVITEIQLGLIPLRAGQTINDQENMLDNTLYWKASLAPTTNPFVSLIDVKVTRYKQSSSIIHMIGYINNDI